MKEGVVGEVGRRTYEGLASGFTVRFYTCSYTFVVPLSPELLMFFLGGGSSNPP